VRACLSGWAQRLFGVSRRNGEECQVSDWKEGEVGGGRCLGEVGGFLFYKTLSVSLLRLSPSFSFFLSILRRRKGSYLVDPARRHMLVSTKRKNFGDRIASTREVLASLAQTKEAMPSDTLKLTGTSLELPLTKRAFERERVAGVMTLGKVKTVEDWTTRSQILPLQQQCWRHGRSSEAKCEWASKKSWFKIWSSPRSYKKYEEQLQRLSHACLSINDFVQ
jgi:hypothetical protein